MFYAFLPTHCFFIILSAKYIWLFWFSLFVVSLLLLYILPYDTPDVVSVFQKITMLFSDIVGFTSICSTCTPMEVIAMLSNLYVQFDRQCGVYDVYKVISFHFTCLMEVFGKKILDCDQHIGTKCDC